MAADTTKNAVGAQPETGDGRGLPLFRVAGVEIRVDASWLIIFVLVLWSLAAGYFPAAQPGYGAGAYFAIGVVATLLFFASVVVHELAHAAVANRHEAGAVRRITLFVFGGMAHLGREPRDARTELGIAAVGPATSLALAGLFWVLATWLPVPPLLGAMLRYLAFINAALAVFNLLPGFPLDGGRILRAVLWMRSGDLRASTVRAANWGSGVAFGLMALGVLQIFAGALVGGLWLMFIGMFLRGAAQTSQHAVIVEQALAGARVRDLMIDHPVAAPPDMTVREAIEELFLRHGFGGFPVGEDGELIGIVSLRHVGACPLAERDTRRVHDVMLPAGPAVEVAADAPLGDALRRMAAADIGRLLVVDGGRIVGMITRTGVTRYVELKTRLEQPGTPPHAG
jgi:Zn-dependent protease/CBS domain-containing protein